MNLISGGCPDFVVIGGPTNMRVARGHKGRCEFRVRAKGHNAHGAPHWLGDNAIYKMQAVLRAIPELDAQLPNDPFLGCGSIVATYIDVRAGSLNAVPADGGMAKVAMEVSAVEIKYCAIDDESCESCQ